MEKITYLAVLEPDGDGGYGVYFPDLPGCVSYGADISEAQAMAIEAASLHVYGMENDGEEIPKASKSLSKKDTEGNLVSPVTIYPGMYRLKRESERVKTNTTIPAWLKRLAETKHVNYSRVLETALMENLGVTGPVMR